MRHIPHQKLLGDGLSTPLTPFSLICTISSELSVFWISNKTASGPSSQVLPGGRVRHPLCSKKILVRHMIHSYALHKTLMQPASMRVQSIIHVWGTMHSYTLSGPWNTYIFQGPPVLSSFLYQAKSSRDLEFWVHCTSHMNDWYTHFERVLQDTLCVLCADECTFAWRRYSALSANMHSCAFMCEAQCTHSSVSYVSLMWGVKHSFMCEDTIIHVWGHSMKHSWAKGALQAQDASFIRVRWCIDIYCTRRNWMLDAMYMYMSASCNIYDAIYIIKHSIAWHDSCMHVAWRIYMCNMTHPHVDMARCSQIHRESNLAGSPRCGTLSTQCNTL